MKDLIDERNRREKMQKSIVKYWNVRYTPVASNSGLEDEKSGEQAMQCQSDADNYEVPENEDVMQETFEEAEMQNQIEKILHEKADGLRDIITEHKE